MIHDDEGDRGINLRTCRVEPRPRFDLDSIAVAG